MVKATNEKLEPVKKPLRKYYSPFKNNIAFVQDELKDLPELKKLPRDLRIIRH